MTQARTFFSIQNKDTKSKTVDVLFYGAIPHYDWETDKVKNTAIEFVTAFKDLEKEFDTINIRVNSPGGSMLEGLPIYNVIASSEKDVHTWNDGVAASMAAVVLMSVKKENIHAAKNSLIMIHPASMWGGGNAKQMAETIKTLEKFDNTIIDVLTALTGKDKEEITSRFFDGKDHWMSAKDAEEYGIIGKVEDYAAPKVIANGAVDKLQNMAFPQICNAFDSLNSDENEDSLWQKIRNFITTHLAENKPTPIIEDTKIDNNMDFKNELAILDKDAPTAEELASVKAAIVAITGENERFTKAEHDAALVQARATAKEEAEKPLKTEVANKQAEIDALKKEVAALKNADGAGAEGAAGGKTDPKVEGAGADDEYKREEFAHNKLADEMLGKF